MTASAFLLERRAWYAQVLLVASIAWGAFAFGAVRPWAYWPLSIAALSLAAATLVARPSPTRPLQLRGLSIAFALFGGAVALQIVPLPLGTLHAVSPHTLDLLLQFDPLISTSSVGRHPLSIEPSLTLRGLALFGSFALLTVASARLLSVRGAGGFAEALTGVGAVLALVGIIQQPLFTGKIYGLWEPEFRGNPFGPFVNRNHFAGWMLMALPVTLGLLSGRLARGLRGVKPTWRDRVLWCSSADASGLILLAAAAVVMAIALVLTMSRSGTSALAGALAVTTLVILRRQHTAGRRAIGIAYLLVLVTLVVAVTGANTMVSHFARADWAGLNNRRGAWADAVSVFRAFPVAGTGFDTYGVAMLFYQRHDLDWHYAQAHNDYLQLAAEGGILLIVPALACVGVFIAAVRRRFREETASTAYWLRVGAVTGLAAIGLQEAVDFSLQMPGNAALFAVLCGIALHRPPERHRASATSK